MPSAGGATELAAMTSDELPHAATALLVPTGSTEQHGPHLPLDTDTRIAVAVAERAARQLAASGSPFLVAPPISYGASGEHRGFLGTVSLGLEALTTVLIEYGRSAGEWASRVVFVNGHGGNVAALRAAVDRLRLEGRDAAWVPCAAAHADAHAGHTETSLLLHLAPETVRRHRMQAGNAAPLDELMPVLRRGGVAAASPIGVLGDPTTATAAAGEGILEEMVDRAVSAIRRWSPGAGGVLPGVAP